MSESRTCGVFAHRLDGITEVVSAPMEVGGRHVLVTGASRGIGASLARSFADAGAIVSVAARSVDALERVASDVRGRAFAVDLLDPSQVDELIPRAETAVGPIDVLVNNAGAESHAWFHTEEPQHIRDVVRLNVEAPLVLARYVLPGMLDRGRGHLVWLSSLAGSARRRINEIVLTKVPIGPTSDGR